MIDICDFAVGLSQQLYGRSIASERPTRMGRKVGPRVAARFGRTLLELGGDNDTVVATCANQRR